MSQECSIVEDLLPFYHKRSLQKNTMLFIEQHIATCTHCQQLAAMPLSSTQHSSMKGTLAFFHLIFIVLSFMFALNSSLLGNQLAFIVSYAIFGCLTYLFYTNIWIVFAISFTPVFIWAIIENFNHPLHLSTISISHIGTVLMGGIFIAILHTVFALLGAAFAIMLRRLFHR